MITEQKPQMAKTGKVLHVKCFACGHDNLQGLQLEFYLIGEGKVETTLTIPRECQGYPGIVQGGITATILDSAMTNCLFAKNVEAVTAELKVRYFHPIPLGETVKVSARVHTEAFPFFVVKAEVRIGSKVMASATGKFVDPEAMQPFRKVRTDMKQSTQKNKDTPHAST